MDLLFATGNTHKTQEVRAMLPEGFRLQSLADMGFSEEIPEEEPTLEGNALHKARFLFQRTGSYVIADDTGLEVKALDGRPGVHSARYAGPAKDDAANREKLLRELEGQPMRQARFRTVIALIGPDEEQRFEGICEGMITQHEKGKGDFGYDPVFQPAGQKLTFAEMDPEAKNSISHRGRAFAKLMDYLSGLDKIR